MKKSLSYWPVICLVGARQVGKSTFLKKIEGYSYHTLDDPGLAELAQRNPKSLLNPPCSLDEVQKVPSLFDAVKLDVDQDRHPGKFILTGSVRFSKRTLIRESLTGRAKTIQIFPFTCAEALELPFENRWHIPNMDQPVRVGRNKLQRILGNGGMPAIFSARNPSETSSYWNSLTESYVYRDLLFTVPKNPKPALALSILKAIAEVLALGELPTFSRILKKVGSTRTQVERHLVGLEDLMIIQRVAPFDAAPTKDIFLPFDSAFFLSLLGITNPLHDAAIHLACLHIRLVQEFLATQQITDLKQELWYAESAQGQQVQIITKSKEGAFQFFQIEEEPVIHAYKQRFLNALVEKNGGKGCILSSIESPISMGALLLRPWESVL